MAKGEARSAASGEVGKIALGYTASSMLSLALPSAIRAFQRAHPFVPLSLHEMTSLDQLAAVHSRALDIGILRKPDVVVPAGIVVEEWFKAPLVAAVPEAHPLSPAPRSASRTCATSR